MGVDSRFTPMAPAAADAVDQSESKKGFATSAAQRMKKKKATADALAVQNARAIRGNDDPQNAAKPVLPPAPPPARETILDDFRGSASEEELVVKLVVGAFMSRGGSSVSLITDARRLVADLKKNKLL